MHTTSARSAQAALAGRGGAIDDAAVTTTAELTCMNVTRAQLRAALDAGRWQRMGRAIVMHNGPLTREQQSQVALRNCGPRSVLTGLMALEGAGLSGWAPTGIDVLAPLGVAPPRLEGLPIRLHTTRRNVRAETVLSRRVHRVAPAMVLTASTMARPRTACGLLAAGVQQGLTTATDLTRAVESGGRVRHRSLLMSTISDISMGAQALSEIDFGRLCSRAQLPLPERQAVRLEPNGRRRYLDALWRLRNGREVAAEVDGALHLTQRQWWSDQLRQNEIVLSGVLVLRFPSVVVRTEPELVVAQLARALGVT